MAGARHVGRGVDGSGLLVGTASVGGLMDRRRPPTVPTRPSPSSPINGRRPMRELAVPPVIFRAGGDHGARVLYWPSYDAAPMAHDGRPDHHVYVRRDIVRAWLAQSPPPAQSPLDTAGTAERGWAGTVRAAWGRAARALRRGWASWAGVPRDRRGRWMALAAAGLLVVLAVTRGCVP